MNTQLFTTVVAVILVAILASCTDEETEQLAANHIQSRSVDGVVEMLLEVCAPDQWCEPYAKDAAKKCVAQFLDAEELVGKGAPEINVVMEAVVDDIHHCASIEVHARYAEDNAQDI